MSSQICDLRSTPLSDGQHLLSCVFQRGPSQGSYERRLLLPWLYWCLQHGWNLTSLCLFIFKMCFSNTLAFLRNIEDSSPFLGVPLSIVFVWRFPEENMKLSESFYNHFCASWIVFPVQYPWGYLILLPVCRPSERSFVSASVGSCLYLSSLWYQGLQSSWLGLLCNWKWRPRKSATWLFFIVVWRRRAQWDIFPSIRQDLFF